MNSPDGTSTDHAPRHPIRVVSERTGLTQETLRAWERRYGVVEPGRSEGGQRLYSDADVRHLQRLVRAVEEGRSIGQVAALTPSQLAELLAEDARERWPSGGRSEAEAAAAPHLAAALEATRALRTGELETVLRRAALRLGVEHFVEGLTLPLLRELGDGWARGELSVAHEHLASAVVRRVLGALIEDAGGLASDRVLVAATPAGQVHEFGALLAGLTASVAGWRVIYLGADLPAADIAEAAHASGAGAVALSLVHPVDDPALPGELAALRDALDPQIRLVVGGPAAAELHGLLSGLGAAVVPSMAALRAELERWSDAGRDAVGEDAA